MKGASVFVADNGEGWDVLMIVFLVPSIPLHLVYIDTITEREQKEVSQA